MMNGLSSRFKVIMYTVSPFQFSFAPNQMFSDHNFIWRFPGLVPALYVWIFTSLPGGELFKNVTVTVELCCSAVQ